MDWSFYAIGLVYVVVARDDLELRVKDEASKMSVAKWLRLRFPYKKIIAGVTRDNTFFDSTDEKSYKLRGRLSNSGWSDDDDDDDKNWAAIILSHLDVESYEGANSGEVGTCRKVGDILKLFQNPDSFEISHEVKGFIEH